MKSYLHVERLVVGQMATNCYLLISRETNEAIIIDPGEDPEYVSDVLERETLKPLMILATHGHFDHILGAYALQVTYALPFLMNKKDEFLIARMEESAKHYLGLSRVDPPPTITGNLKDNGGLEFGKDYLVIKETPGHTPGSVCIYAKNNAALFAGDLLFAGGAVGRTDFAYSSAEKLASSVKKILRLPGKTIVYPGHGETVDIAELKQ